jgi:hypothetical protein
MVPRILTTTLLAALAAGLAACGSSSPTKPASAEILSVLHRHYADVADAKLDAACNDQTVGFQNAFAQTFGTQSCPAAMLTYRRRLVNLGSWTTQALRDVTVTGLKISGDAATARVRLSNPTGGIDVPMGQVKLARVGKQWMIADVVTD